jgi:fructan beta-fructosidase
MAMMRAVQIGLTVLAVAASLAVEGADGAMGAYQEPFRPQLHFSPPAHWMNDPNGMVYAEGEYHLFYQFHPFSTVWGPMHWGHAVSTDLVHWSNLPIALYPDSHGAIFSGSVVYDRANTSGLGTPEHPPLVAIFTYNDHALELHGSVKFQTQGLAYSIDRGRSWQKYAGNPVLDNPGTRDFRDPKVSWYEAGHEWIMTLAAGDHVSFYSSADLKHWAHESDFGLEWGAHNGVWECPDLVPMAVEGERTRRDVLLVSINRSAAEGGSATQYFIGQFDSHAFRLDGDLRQRLGQPPGQRSAEASWIDRGADDYAGVTWSGVPPADGRPLFIGWMNNWAYAQAIPTGTWRGAMTLPRELRLVRTARGLEVHSLPVAELAQLRLQGAPLPAGPVLQPLNLVAPASGRTGLLELDARLDMRDAGVIALEFGNAEGEVLGFRINRKLRRYELDRSRSGRVEFSPAFSRLQIAPMPASGGQASDAQLGLRVFLDRSSIEIFVNDGETVLTDQIFPQHPYTSVILSADRGIDLRSGTAYDLQSIWPQPH